MIQRCLSFRGKIELKEEQYRALCEACDGVLSASDTSVERVAIAWLHIIREHPIFLENYRDIFNDITPISRLINLSARTLRNNAIWLRQLLKFSFSDGGLWHGSEKLPESVDIIFVSHLLNTSQAGQGDDFYFGHLPRELAAQNRSALIVLINHTDLSAEEIAGKWKNCSVPRVVLCRSLPLTKEVALRKRLNKEAMRLKLKARAATSIIDKRVLVHASHETSSSGAISALRMADQISDLLTKHKPKAIIMTHEGHAWERLMFWAARSVDPTISCIGYQHAAIFRLQHSIRRNLSNEYNPDVILTAGDVSKAQFKNTPAMAEKLISVLGSNRCFAAISSTQSAEVENDLFQMKTGAICLVIPEGLASECNQLFEFSLACAEELPEIQFVWRLHPVISFNTLTRKNPRLRHLPPNIEVSSKNFNDDLKRSRWAIYRGSTAIVTAVAAGVRPIYFYNESELSIDPLYDLGVWKEKCINVSEFKHAVQNRWGTETLESSQAFEEARRYCNSFYTPFDISKLEKILTCTQASICC